MITATRVYHLFKLIHAIPSMNSLLQIAKLRFLHFIK